MQASFLFSELKTGLRRNVTMTIAVVVTTAISLAFFGLAVLLGKQVGVMKGYWYDKVEVSVFMCSSGVPSLSCSGQEVTPEQQAGIQAVLDGMPQLVESVEYESKQEAFTRFKEQFAGRTIADKATVEGMPASFRVKLRDPGKASEVADALRPVPGVDNVNDMRDILGKLFKILDGLRYLALALAIAQVVAALLLIMNTVRLAAVNRREETGIMRLVGASSWSIQAPFILQSALAGLIGAVLASGLLLAGYQLIVADQLAQNYRVTAYIGSSAVWATIPLIVLLGVGLAGLASFFTLRRYLKV